MVRPLSDLCQAVVERRPAAHLVLQDYLRERGWLGPSFDARSPRRIVEELLCNGRLPSQVLHRIACAFAERVLPTWEAHYPDNPLPRRAIELKRAWLRGEATDRQLEDAWIALGMIPRGRGAPAAAEAAWRAIDTSPRSAAWEAALHASRLASWRELLLIAARQLDQELGLSSAA